jgi:acetyl-CoA carboxylase biotin carboxyl carrier protein
MSKKGDVTTDTRADAKVTSKDDLAPGELAPGDLAPGDLAPGDLAPGDLAVDGALVRTLAALLAETGLSEIEYAVGDRRIRVARNVSGIVSAAGTFAAAPVPAAAPAAEPALATHPGAVKAPMVGTVYLSPQPEAPTFAKLGDMVSAGQPLLIIEAMKVMNQIRAPRAGRLAQILVEDGTPVEYGEVVMVLE